MSKLDNKKGRYKMLNQDQRNALINAMYNRAMQELEDTCGDCDSAAYLAEILLALPVAGEIDCTVGRGGGDGQG